MVVLHQCERKIDPGRHPGRGQHATVADEDRVRLERDPGEALGEPGLGRPVSRRPAPVEQLGRGEHERPGAHRRGLARAAGQTPDSADQLGALRRLRRPRSTRHEQPIDRLGERLQHDLRRQRHADRRLDRATTQRPKPQFVIRAELVRKREHLQRSNDVKQPHPVIEHYQHRANRRCLRAQRHERSFPPHALSSMTSHPQIQTSWAKPGHHHSMTNNCPEQASAATTSPPHASRRSSPVLATRSEPLVARNRWTSLASSGVRGRGDVPAASTSRRRLPGNQAVLISTKRRTTPGVLRLLH